MIVVGNDKVEILESVIDGGDAQKMEVKNMSVDEGTMRLSFLKLKELSENCPEFKPHYIVVMCGINLFWFLGLP